MSDIVDKFRFAIEPSDCQRIPKSFKLGDVSQKYLPSGVVHDSRDIKIYDLYSCHAMRSIKCNFDRNEYIDYFSGRDALMLSHNNLQVINAMKTQLMHGTQFTNNHKLKVIWA